ncbi:MAG: hypothetical protein FWD69_07420 [Polyangiaceae bacterium]|nr:hypothetical protein [Polyangiaceae bacterium]
MGSEDKKGTDLPPSVARALARARAKVEGRTKPSLNDRWLALIPVGAAVIMGALMLPRAAAPSSIPLPDVDERTLGRTVRDDRARAARAIETRLPGDVLAMGSAIRAFNALQLTHATEDDIMTARRAIDDARAKLATREDAVEDLLSLRALQLASFLAEVERFEAAGVVSRDLEELGGGFIDRMRDAGWVERARVVLTPSERRSAFKVVWNAIAGVDQVPAFALTLDEHRALYTLYIAHPHPTSAQRMALDARRRAATTEAARERADEDFARATELWRIDKIRLLGKIDAAYPTAYALGVAYFRAGRFDLSIEQFRAWITAHPDGPFTLRARNHLKAAVSANGSF